MGHLYDEDYEEIKDGIDLLYKRQNIDRLDVKLTDPNATALVYWAGTVLRVDIKGLR